VRRVSGGKQIPAIYLQFFGTAYLAGTSPYPSPNPTPTPNPNPSPSPIPINQSIIGVWVGGSYTGTYDRADAKYTLVFDEDSLMRIEHFKFLQ
jgi:hypothetical protein